MDGLDLMTVGALVRALEAHDCERTVAIVLSVVYEVWGKHTHAAVLDLVYRLTDDEVCGRAPRPDMAEVMRRTVNDR